METHTHVHTITHTAGFPFKYFHANSDVLNQKSVTDAANYDEISQILQNITHHVDNVFVNKDRKKILNLSLKKYIKIFIIHTHACWRCVHNMKDIMLMCCRCVLEVCVCVQVCVSSCDDLASHGEGAQ